MLAGFADEIVYVLHVTFFFFSFSLPLVIGFMKLYQYMLEVHQVDILAGH